MRTDFLSRFTSVATMLLIPIVAYASEPLSAVQRNELMRQVYRTQIPFIENRGQLDPADVRYYAHTCGGMLFVETNGTITYSLSANRTVVVIKETFSEAQGLTVAGTAPSRTAVNYFSGSDTSQWHSNIPTYARVSLGTIQKGIDLTLVAYGNNVEKLFTILPGASPEAIRVTVEGARELRINAKGELELVTPCGLATFTRPVGYQGLSSDRQYVEVAYAIDDNTYGFRVGAYDTTRPLVIDPLLASTFIGGSERDRVTVQPFAVSERGSGGSVAVCR